MLHIDVRNESSRKRLYRRDVFCRLAERVCREEHVEGDLELSVLLCDDPFIEQLNRSYRKKSGPTDVLSFGQDVPEFHGARVLGDIVISLETVERYCGGDPAAMRSEVRLLFCHGLLHLLGFEHKTDFEQQAMNERQAHYLGIGLEAAWHARPPEKSPAGKKARPRRR